MCALLPQKVIQMADRINAKGYHPAYLADEGNCISCGMRQDVPDAVFEVFKP